MKILSKGTKISRKSLVSSRKFNNEKILARSAHNELTSDYSRLKTKTAFTMAEILLSLTIIGVVAAITLPSLTGNINERTWSTQRKALYARMSQAVALMPYLNGYGTSTDNAAETFITSGLSKVFKVNNICGNNNLQECGLPSKIIPLQGSAFTLPTKISELNGNMISNDYGSDIIKDSNAAAFESQNGESILLFYNRECQFYKNEYDMKNVYNHFFTQPKVCANLIFDMNGKKGPNTVGKDIGFLTILYPVDSLVVAPDLPVQRAATNSAKQKDAMGLCTKQDESYRIPSSEELISMFVNQKLLTGEIATSNTDYWSSRVATSTLGWSQGWVSGAQWVHDRESEYNVWCVKR